MRSIVSSLNMFMLDYLIVPIWTVFSVLGNVRSAYIMIPITLVFIIINYFNTRNMTKLLLLDMNLAAASMVGIMLNSFLFIRFIYADPQVMTRMMMIIFAYVLYIILGCVACMLFKSLYHRHNMRIINNMADDDREFGTFSYEDDEDEDDEDNDEEEDDEDDEEEEYDVKERRGFLSSVTGFLKRSDEDDEEDEDEAEDDENEDDEEEDDDGYVKPSGPKFRVIKK